MTLPEFLTELFAEGRVAVPKPAEALAEAEVADATDVLAAQDKLCRLELPAGTPPIDEKAAIWAAVHFYRACQLAMFRDVGEPAITKLGEKPLEAWDSAAVHYSVD